jgi:hypothetical protein
MTQTEQITLQDVSNLILATSAETNRRLSALEEAAVGRSAPDNNHYCAELDESIAQFKRGDVVVKTFDELQAFGAAGDVSDAHSLLKNPF